VKKRMPRRTGIEERSLRPTNLATEAG